MAYHRETGKFALTHESAQTRLFLNGRTETVRAFSKELKTFIQSMEDSSTTPTERKHLLKIAADKHKQTYTDCMSGKGIDRHLFSLYVVCKQKGYDSSFLKSALTLPWILSTRQVPHTQMNSGVDVSIPELNGCTSPGGGFGPVSDAGYGVSYIVPDDHRIYFHISSKHHSGQTNSQKFLNNLYASMADIKNMIQEADLRLPSTSVEH